MDTLIPIAVTLWMGGLVVAIYSHLQKKDKRRRAEMKKAAVRWEGPAEMHAYDKAMLREKEMLAESARRRGPIDYFELGRTLAAKPWTCLCCSSGYHGLTAAGEGCTCPCHQDEKVPA